MYGLTRRVEKQDLTQHLDRTKRVKDAKSEAQKEIDEYRQKKEEEYQKYESEVKDQPR